MDRCSGKRGAGALTTPRKECCVAFKNPACEGNQNSQSSSRIGCSRRIKYSKNLETGNADKAKCSHAFRSSNGKEIIGKFSRSCSVMASTKSSNLHATRAMPSQLEFDPSECSASGELEAPELMPSPSRSPTRYLSESANTSVKVTATEIGSSSVSSNVKPQKMFQDEKSGSQNQNFFPSASKSTRLGAVSSNDESRYGLKNFKYNNISDVVPRNCGKNVMKKVSPEGESSLSHGGRKTTSALCINGDVTPSTSGIVISDMRHTSFGSGEYSSGISSVRNRRLMAVNTRMRFSYQHNGRNNSSLAGPDVGISQFPVTEIPVIVGGQSTSANASSSGSSSYSSCSSNNDYLSSLMPYTSPEFAVNHLTNPEAWQHYSMNGIAEVLLALERIEQDEELTQEQVLALETSLFLSGLNLYDQHRDMRLDVDNMSYEELLALEERMGIVSTALSEEALSKCLSRSIYQATPSEVRVTGSGEDGDDIKCSICQEEYEFGDEVGKLVECQHGYHISCINQWLRLKNWCPICKSAATPSQQSSS